MQTSTMNPGQPVEFYNDSGAIEEGVIVEGPSYRALSGCTINKYSNGSMGTWGQGLRVRYEMSDEELNSIVAALDDTGTCATLKPTS